MPSSTDTATNDAPTQTDEGRTALLEALQAELGDALIESHLVPGVDLTVRITNQAWTDTAAYLRERQRFRFFDFISAIDWLPSPFGRSMDAAVDAGSGEVETPDDESGEGMVSGVAGGDTRFQVFARVYSLTTHLGVTLKTDIGDPPTVGTWVNTYPGAEWHEREVWEMFGITFEGHPGLRPLYLPGGFEGFPMRKDFPLLARIIKPWPGLVDVEPMPEVDGPEPAVTDSAVTDSAVTDSAVTESASPSGDAPAQAASASVPLGSETVIDSEPTITAAPDAPDSVDVAKTEFPESPLADEFDAIDGGEA